MSLEIIFGKNKTGKTKYLEDTYNNIKNPNVLFIQAEIDFDGILKGNLGTAKNIISSPHKKIIDFLNNIIGKSFMVKVSDNEEYNKFINFQQSINNFIDKLREIDDEFFEDCFKNSFKTIDLNDEFEYKFELIEISNTKRNGSSGSLNYSLLKLLYEMSLNYTIQINDQFTLVIDEIEKFLHPELIFKIANMIVDVSEKINVVLTTHSPLFLERIFYIHKNKIINNLNCDINYSLKYKFGNDKIFTFDTNEISKILKNKNYRTITNLSHFLFSSKCFFIEGFIDNSIINDIINTNSISNPYTIIDCNDKGQVKIMLEIARSLSIIPYYQICLFYDSDSNKNGKIFKIYENEKDYVSCIVNDPDIEESLFNVEKDSNMSNKTTHILIKNGEITAKNFKKEKISDEKRFIFTTKWIKENSTKSENELNSKINELTEQIKKFMSK